MMVDVLIVSGLLGAAALQGGATPKPYVYCEAQSTSPRGPGLIVTSVFRSRADPKFVESVFTNYLRGSYAPYGNGWIIDEKSPSCSSFIKKSEADYQRQLAISRIPQPVQSIFRVTFVMD